MHLLRTIYKALRGILFTAIIFVAVVYLALYVILSVPAFQNKVKERAVKEASAFLSADVRAGQVIIKPFSEVVIKELEVFDRSGQRCLAVETVGAGISLWTLFRERRIELTYAEIIGLDGKILQEKEGEPLNISFIIEAFRPKDKNKPPAKFNLNLRNVVIRRSTVSFNRNWKPRLADGRTDFNHLRLWDVKADLNLPRIANDDFIIDLRRLSFMLSGGLEVRKIGLQTHITSTSLTVENLSVQLPHTHIIPSDITLSYNGFSDLPRVLESGLHQISLLDNPVSLSDFAWLVPKLSLFPDSLLLSLDAEGNLDSLKRVSVRTRAAEGGLDLSFSTSADNLRAPNEMSLRLSDLNLKVSSVMTASVAERLPGINPKIVRLLNHMGNLELKGESDGFPKSGDYNGNFRLDASCGDLEVSAKGKGLKNKSGSLDVLLTINDLSLGDLLGRGLPDNITGEVRFDGKVAGRDLSGELTAMLDAMDFNGYSLTGVSLHAVKSGDRMSIEVESANKGADLSLEAEGELAGNASWGKVRADIRSFDMDIIGNLPGKYQGFHWKGRMDAEVYGDHPDCMTGELRINDLKLDAPGKGRVGLDCLILKAQPDTVGRVISVKSDWITGNLRGNIRFSSLIAEAKCMMGKVLPALVQYPSDASGFSSDMTFDFTIADNNTIPDFFNLPFRFLVPVPVSGSVDPVGNLASFHIDAPFLQQGRNKLIRGFALDAALDGLNGTLGVKSNVIMPMKRGEVKLDLQLYGKDNIIFTELNWGAPADSNDPDRLPFDGMLSLEALLSRDVFTHKPEVKVDVSRSDFDFGPAHWTIEPATITYNDNTVAIEGMRIWHDNQFVEIEGVASSSPLDSVNVKLASIDVGYIFDALNINYVTFGGTATGELAASGAFSKEPIAATDNLFIKDLSYNGGVLGDGSVRSEWHNDEKMISIEADIKGNERNVTVVDGGIWLSKDSLRFDVDADRLPVEFLSPFMSAFASGLQGKASGKARLFGTFHDIDLIGRLKADSLSMKLDYTNVVYHGSDSVIMSPGKITIPSFRLYDRDGHSGLFSGELTHRYFHDPSFTFRMSDADRLLCYDTNAGLNPDWYGTLYGTGIAVVRGVPGLVSVSVDMNLVNNSTFNFILNDRLDADDYKFLTFSDRRRTAVESQKRDSVQDILSKFRRNEAQNEDIPTTFKMDVRASVSPSTLMTLVMDPVSGDKITARGNGNIQVDYDTESDQMQMFGKYILEEGNYNFSLQDLILRDFTIRRGSSIAFNGDPLNAILDITASYRVNTNLSDLDKSFSTDRDLARTNVPVDAILMVDGQMQQPEITFDIELPTLTQDVERKVKSIISTDDMMNRQIIYLLALNRFSTPEYMGASRNGGELASVASSTLSSQLSNMLGQLTDKFSVAPSFRSDKGDFSDIEVDVALSSRLLNNRLIINGNFGYRDRATSQTTFVGDFDIEYILRRGGNLRLKAYNHFNDQNYYLRQALTTQGLGLIYRKEFDNPFSKFRKRRDKDENTEDKEEVEKAETEKDGADMDISDGGEGCGRRKQVRKNS